MKITLVAVLFAFFALQGMECPAQTIPNPVLYLINHEHFSSGGKSFVRYQYGVDNSSSIPDALFAPAPTLPACGSNTNSSRTWVDFFDQSGKRLNGFCALTKSDKLNGIWFALEEGVVPPSWVFIELKDRQTGLKYKSNLADTTN